jgi:hypothetical protein
VSFSELRAGLLPPRRPMEKEKTSQEEDFLEEDLAFGILKS